MAWLRLLRIAALPSALSNLLIGFLLANRCWQPSAELLWLLLASGCLYCAGMVLNDVFDVEVDRAQRPSRPLPSGAVSVSTARIAGFALLLLGPVLAMMASMFSLALAAALGVTIYLYDGPLKKTALAPVLMGCCRTLNIILGASVAAAIEPWVCLYALAIGIFVAGITVLARREAEASQSATHLIPGSALMVGGMALAGYFAWKFAAAESSDEKLSRLLPIAFGFLCLPILRRLAIALSTTSGASVKAAVVTSLRSLIVFDACMALLIDAGRPVYSCVFLALLGASWLLGRVTKLT